MTTPSSRAERAAAANRTFKIVKDNLQLNFVSNLKRSQLNDLKTGLKEALLINAGKMEAHPFSTLWDE